MTTPDPPPSGGTGSPGRRRSVIALVGVVVVVVVAATAVALTRGDDDDTAAPGSGTSATSQPTASGTPSSSPAPAPTTGAPSTSPGATAPSAAPTTAPRPGATVPTADPPPTTRAPIDATGDLGNGVRVEVERVQSVQGKARGVGEVAAPSVRFTIAVTNGTGRRVSLDSSVVNVSYGRDRAPASQLSGPGAEPMPSGVGPGRTARGTYVFSVPESGRGRVQIAYSYTVAAPTVVFAGAVS